MWHYHESQGMAVRLSGATLSGKILMPAAEMIVEDDVGVRGIPHA